MIKNIYKTLIIILTLILTVGCVNTKNSENNKNTNEEIVDSKVKGNCAAVECIKLIGATDTVEEINNIIGFKGESQNEYNDIYYWQITEKTSIEVAFSGGEERNMILARIPQSMLKNKKVNLSNTSALYKGTENGKSLFYKQLDYEQMKTYLGNVDGVLIAKDKVSLAYEWVLDIDVYAQAEFSIITGKCISLFIQKG